MENWCYFCKQEGKDVVARSTVDKRPACAAHYMAWRKEHHEESAPSTPADRPVAPPIELPPVEVTPLKKRLDYAAMQKDRDDGMGLHDIATKYQCSYSSVSINTHKTRKPVADQPLRRPPGRPPIVQKKTPPAFSKNMTISELLAKLTARRDALNEAIECLQMTEKLLAQSEELQ